MNPNAKPFTFNLDAPSWTPDFLAPAAPAAEPEPVVAAEPEPVAAVEEETVEGEEEIDENDPLWIVTLKVCNGDKKAALKLLEDPDQLASYPEIMAVMSTLEDGEEGDETEVKAEPEAEVKAEPLAIETPVETPIETPVQTPAKAAKKDEPEEEKIPIVVQEGDKREHLNVVFIGHVDAGKSTLSGSILYLMGKVDKRTIERFEKEAKERNRESWFLAYIMDTGEEERSKGITVEVGRAPFETEKNRYTILDAPGHKSYVPNMISGASQADVGILVISARKGEFETGFEKGGQTKEHALLARTLGVNHLIVVINKMDDPTVNWSKDRYEECITKLKPYLRSVGYAVKKDVKFLPISGLTSANVLNEVDSSVCPWWKEYVKAGEHNTSTPTLISTLDNLTISGRNPNGTFRMPVLDRYTERGTVVIGKVESGTLRVGDELILSPTKKKAKVEEIQIADNYVLSAKPGENVLVKLGCNLDDVQKGFVLSSPSSPCPAVTEILAELALVDMLEHRPLFTPGYECVMHIHTQEIEVNCTDLVCVIDKGKKVKRPFGRTGQGCVAKLVFQNPTCMDIFDNFPAIGRITLRDEGRTIAIGKVIRLGKSANM